MSNRFDRVLPLAGVLADERYFITVHDKSLLHRRRDVALEMVRTAEQQPAADLQRALQCCQLFRFDESDRCLRRAAQFPHQRINIPFRRNGAQR